MTIVQQLGVNGTAIIQFFLFIGAIIILQNMVFRPFAAALELRESKTFGSGQDADELHGEIARLNQELEVQVRALALDIREKFERSKAEAQAEIETLAKETRASSDLKMKSFQTKLDSEVAQAKASGKVRSQDLAQEMMNKVLAPNQRMAQ